MVKKLFFVINPLAGSKSRKKEEIYSTLKSFCKQNSYQCFFYHTKGVNDKDAIEKFCLDEKPDAVIAVGGDGTVNMVGEVLVNSDTPLGIIPMGSANGLAKDLGIPKNIHESLKVIKEFFPYEIDCLKVDGKNCFHVSDFGFNARIVRRFSESLTRGKISYAWYGVVEFFFFKPFQYEIETDEHKIEGEAFMITVTNANRFGTNVNINPLGKINDGCFEISIIKPFSKIKSFAILYRLFNNTIHKSKYNRVIRCTKATINNVENTPFHIDGEPSVLQKKLTIRIVPKGLKILIPCCR